MPVPRRTLLLAAAVVAGGVAVPATAAVVIATPAPATPGVTPATTAPRPGRPVPPRTPLVPRPAAVVPSLPQVVTPTTVPGAPVVVVPSFGPFAVCRVPAPASRAPTKVKPADPGVLAAFGILRRPREARDEVPAAVRRALTAQGYADADLEGARLLRSTAAGGTAWIVPVAEVRAGCATALPTLPSPRGALREPLTRPATPLPDAPSPSTPVVPRPRADRAGPPAALARRAPTPATVPPIVVRPLPPVPPFASPIPDVPTGPGVVVLATGDAPGGAGGTLRQLVRGLAPVEVRSCAGPDAKLLSVSGLVPDGVAFVHLTRKDGTAVRADVVENGYQFLVPPDRDAAQTYVTWTGGDGTPHVQPLPLTLPSSLCLRRSAKARTQAAAVVRTSPGPTAAFDANGHYVRVTPALGVVRPLPMVPPERRR